MSGPALYTSSSGVHRADDCLPLREAARRGNLLFRAVARGSYPGHPLPDGVLGQLRSAGTWDARRDQAWGLDWHRNEGVEFTFLSRGRLPFSVGRRNWLLRRGHLTVTRPWQAHRVGAPNVTASRLHWMILDVGVRGPHEAWSWPDWLVCSREDLRRLTLLLRHNEKPVWSAGPTVARAFEELSEAATGRLGPREETRLRLAVNQILISVLEFLDGKRIPLERSLTEAERTVRLFLERLPGCLSEPWTLDTMAAECGLGRTRFAHYCRRLRNLSPLDCLAMARVEAAARRLRAEPDARITDVALDCGFSSSQYFATVFRKFLSCSPGEYRLRAASTAG